MTYRGRNGRRQANQPTKALWMMERQTDRSSYEQWSGLQFARLRGGVAFIETIDARGEVGIGTAFHIGEGSFVTARHVVEHRTIRSVGFDDFNASQELLSDPRHWGTKQHGSVDVLVGPYYHVDSRVDVACFKADPYPSPVFSLGGHLNDWMSQYELVLYRTLILGYPPIPTALRPVLVAMSGEINALVDESYAASQPHFIISTMARGGFSGAPVLVAYDANNEKSGTALLGLVTSSLGTNHRDPELGFMAVLTVEPIYSCLEEHGLLPTVQALKGDCP